MALAHVVREFRCEARTKEIRREASAVCRGVQAEETGCAKALRGRGRQDTLLMGRGWGRPARPCPRAWEGCSVTRVVLGEGVVEGAHAGGPLKEGHNSKRTEESAVAPRRCPQQLVTERVLLSVQDSLVADPAQEGSVSPALERTTGHPRDQGQGHGRWRDTSFFLTKLREGASWAQNAPLHPAAGKRRKGRTGGLEVASRSCSAVCRQPGAGLPVGSAVGRRPPGPAGAAAAPRRGCRGFWSVSTGLFFFSLGGGLWNK